MGFGSGCSRPGCKAGQHLWGQVDQIAAEVAPCPRVGRGVELGEEEEREGWLLWRDAPGRGRRPHVQK